MKVAYKSYEIEILDEPTYQVRSKNNAHQYQYEYFDGAIIKNLIYPLNKRGIAIRSNDGLEEVASVIICEHGGRTTVDASVFEIVADAIWICIGDKLYSFSLPSLELAWHGSLNLGTHFSIHSFNEDLLVFGELGLTCIDTSGSTKWDYIGKGIFMASAKNIQIEPMQITLLDANNTKHIIDETGTPKV